MTKNFKHGDTVRVSWEFRTKAATSQTGGSGEYILVCDLDNEVGSAYVPASSVELVKRRTPEVDDVINSRRELDHLPDRSVVVNRFGSPMIVQAAGTTSALGKHTPFGDGADNGPYRVVFVP
jgi:hypothetical protein